MIAVIRWIPPSVGTVQAAVPRGMCPLIWREAGISIGLHEMNNFHYEAKESQEHASQQTYQADPRLVQIFAEIISGNESAQHR
jgi:hypothetical protein